MRAKESLATPRSVVGDHVKLDDELVRPRVVGRFSFGIRADEIRLSARNYYSEIIGRLRINAQREIHG